MDDETLKVKKAAWRLISFKPRSEKELRERLAMKKADPARVDEVVEALKREKLIDDERFAKLFALSRVQGRAMGRQLVRRELAAKGLDARSVERAMEAVADIDEMSVAMELARTRLRSMRSVPAEAKRRRLHGLLMRRGFASQVIFNVIRTLTGGSEEGME